MERNFFFCFADLLITTFKPRGKYFSWIKEFLFKGKKFTYKVTDLKIKYFQTIEQLLHPSTVTIALNGKREIALFCYNKKPHFKVTQTGILQIISCKTENLQRGLYCATTDADYEHNLLCMIYTETWVSRVLIKNLSLPYCLQPSSGFHSLGEMMASSSKGL